MKIATAWSTQADEQTAVRQAFAMLTERLGAAPDLLLLFASEVYQAQGLLDELRRHAPKAVIHGASSCQGVMTEEGFHSEHGRGLGLLGIHDPQGSYGVGACRIGANPKQSALEAARKALQQAQRPGEVPATVLMTAAPGCEEMLVRGIEEYFGPEVPIMGGSAADNSVAGYWRQYANTQVYQDAVVLTTMFPSAPLSFAFHSGYEPTGFRGRVTRATGRTLFEIDHQPAAVLYNDWAGGELSSYLGQESNVMAQTTMHPLGRVVGSVEGVESYLLSHPLRITPQNALVMFADANVGDEVVLMRGTRDSLVNRAGRVARSALEPALAQGQPQLGGLVVYCAGCMLAVREAMPEVVTNLRGAFESRPFLGVFTFGEQGCLPNGQGQHGNLMISVLTFGGMA